MENNIASRIRNRLDELGKSAASVSLEAGLGRSAIQDILSGRVGNPRFDTLLKLADALECSVNYLTGIQDKPEDGIRWSTMNEYSLFDAIPSGIRGTLASGVFLEVHGDNSELQLGDDTPRHLAYRDLRRPDMQVELWEQGDESLAGIGILKGDILTVTDLDYEEIALKPGRIVVVKRVIGLEGPIEMSARLVTVEKGILRLDTRPLDGKPRPVTIASKRALNGEELSNPNFYWTDGASQSWVKIEGMVIRVTRETSFFD